MSELEQDLRRVEDERERTIKRAEELETEASTLATSLETAGDEERDARAEITAAQGAKDEASQALERAHEIHRQRRTSVEEQSARVTEVRVRSAQAQQRVESDRASKERLERSIEELDAREERLRGDVSEGAAEQGRISAEVVITREELSGSARAAMDAHEALGALRARYEEARNALGASEAELRTLRTEIEKKSGRLSELTLRERELSMEVGHLLDQIHERHRVDLTRVLGDYHYREEPDASVMDRVGELQRLIERMGEINLMAIEEYEEKAQRYDYLSGQQKDLEDALIQLERAIRQMNRESGSPRLGSATLSPRTWTAPTSGSSSSIRSSSAADAAS